FLPENMGSRRVGDFYRAPINPYRPRVSFARGFSIEPAADRAWARAAGAGADGRRVVLDRQPAPAPVEGTPGKGFVVARIAEERPERVVAEVSSDAAGILVLTDVAYPGWKARADGNPAEILLADGVFRGVALPAGSHRVVFAYRPASVIAGGAISAAALVVFLLLARRGEPRRAGAAL
ncbi:MAG TPA: YfhO family protein, partial [Thermoanaerobaculia bacterium]